MIDKIKNASTEALIQFLAVHQVLKINKEMAIQIMLELDNRRANGEVLDLVQIDRLSTLLKSVGSGSIIKTIPSQIDNIQKTLTITTIKISQDLLFAGKISEEAKKEILNITGVLEILEDKEIINDTVSSRVPEIGEIFRGFIH